MRCLNCNSVYKDILKHLVKSTVCQEQYDMHYLNQEREKGLKRKDDTVKFIMRKTEMKF